MTAGFFVPLEKFLSLTFDGRLRLKHLLGDVVSVPFHLMYRPDANAPAFDAACSMDVLSAFLAMDEESRRKDINVSVLLHWMGELIAREAVQQTGRAFIRLAFAGEHAIVENMLESMPKSAHWMLLKPMDRGWQGTLEEMSACSGIPSDVLHHSLCYPLFIMAMMKDGLRSLMTFRKHGVAIRMMQRDGLSPLIAKIRMHTDATLPNWLFWMRHTKRPVEDMRKGARMLLEMGGLGDLGMLSFEQVGGEQPLMCDSLMSFFPDLYDISREAIRDVPEILSSLPLSPQRSAIENFVFGLDMATSGVPGREGL